MNIGVNALNFDDESHFEKGGIWYPNAENFPACKLLFHQDDINNGDLTWTDRINGMILTASESFLKDELGVRYGTGSNPAISGASFSELSTIADKTDFITVFTGFIPLATITVKLGDAVSGQGIALKGGANEYLTFDGANYHELAALPVSYPIHALSAHADISANDTIKHGANSSGSIINSVSKAGGSAGTVDKDWTGFSDVVEMTTSQVSGMDMIALFAFSSPVLDVAAGNAWMAANPGKLYPGWSRTFAIGRT